MRVHGLLIGVAALALAGCGASTPVAAPVTVTHTLMRSVPVTATETATVVSTQLSTVTETTESIYVQTVTNQAKAAPPVTVTRSVPTTVAQTVMVTSTAAAPVAAAPTPDTSAGFPDGTYLIGSEIPAGNYRASGGDSPTSCIWTIKDSTNTVMGGDFTTVAAIPADGYSFDSIGCGTWHAIS